MRRRAVIERDAKKKPVPYYWPELEEIPDWAEDKNLLRYDKLIEWVMLAIIFGIALACSVALFVAGQWAL